jgi:hypothetical protein
LDHELFDFLASLPAELLIDRRFHTDTIHRMHPEFADIPFSGDLGMPAVDDAWHQRRLLAETSAYLLASHTSGLVRRVPTIRRLLSLVLSRGENLHRRASQWIAPLHVLYLAQLERLIEGRAGAPYER